MNPIAILQPQEVVLIKRLFTRVMNQGFGPSQSKKVLAFWLCLWRDYIECSFPEDILRISETLMKEVIDEARTCIQHLRARTCVQRLLVGYRIPEEVNQHFLMTTRTLILKEFCLKSLFWNRQRIMAYMDAYETRLVEELCGGLQPPFKAALLNQQVVQFGGGFPRIWTGPRQSSHLGLFRGSVADTSSSLSHTSTGTAQPIDARSLFLTFSSGFSVSRQEIEEYINRRYGSRVLEALIVPTSNDPLRPPMFAKLVLRSAADVTQVIGGMVDSASFSINTKPVWMRRHTSYECSQLMFNIYIHNIHELHLYLLLLIMQGI